MKIIFPAQINEAVEALRQGKIIIYPTETSYGVGCDATNDSSVARLFALKGRTQVKGTTVLIADISEASKYIHVSPKALEIMEKYWPGPLNVIGSIVNGSPISNRCAQGDTQSIRVSSHPIASELVLRFGKPIVSTSANVSAQTDIYRASDIELSADMLIDAGELPRVLPSTCVQVIGDVINVVRQGEIRL